MGADEKRLIEYNDYYLKAFNLDDLAKRYPFDNKINDRNWKNFIGQRDQFANYLTYFDSKLKQCGIVKINCIKNNLNNFIFNQQSSLK